MMSTRYQLVMRSGPNPGATYALDADQITIGRDPTNTITINDPEISRHHARMNAQGGKIVLEDNGSTNGTAVNGNRIAGPHVLKPGEMIAFGDDISFVFEALSFDPDATVVSSPQPSVAPRQQPVAAPPPPKQPYVGQVPADPVPSPPPTDSQSGSRATLPIVVGVGVLAFICVCGGFFWWIDATYRWCTFFPFIAGCG